MFEIGQSAVYCLNLLTTRLGHGRASTTERVSVNCMELVIPFYNLQSCKSLLKIQSAPMGNYRESAFDGDEMNIFVPQSIQTQIELEEIYRRVSLVILSISYFNL